MAKTKPTEKIYNMELPLPAEAADYLLAKVEDAEGLSDSQKIGGIALGLLQKVASGGLMISSEEIARLVEATGIEEPTCGEDLVDVLSSATGIREGKPSFAVTIDPVYLALYEEPARIQGREVGDLMQEIVDSIFDNDGLGYLVSGTPRIMRMLETDYQALKEVLGEDFDTGTKLAGIIRKLFDNPMAPEGDGEAELSNVGQDGGDL